MLALQATGTEDIVQTGMNGYMTQMSERTFAEKLMDILEKKEIDYLSQGAFATAGSYESSRIALKAEEAYRSVFAGCHKKVAMPRMDGITMVMRMREKGYEFPVIMLSAKSEEVDKIMGLNMGADDYVTKPFTTMELLARVNSHLRRYCKFLEAVVEKKQNEKIHVIGGLELNEETVEVFVDGKPVKMTPIEFKILMLLMKNPGRVFSAEEIYERVWRNRRTRQQESCMCSVM